MTKNSGLVLILLLVAVSQFAAPSTARLLPGEIFPVLDDVIFAGEAIPVPKEEGQRQPQVVDCGDDGHAAAQATYPPGIFAGKYGSLVLNALPKGKVPASGSSKRSNDVKT